jgi:hypothetical protein
VQRTPDHSNPRRHTTALHCTTHLDGTSAQSKSAHCTTVLGDTSAQIKSEHHSTSRQGISAHLSTSLLRGKVGEQVLRDHDLFDMRLRNDF